MNSIVMLLIGAVISFFLTKKLYGKSSSTPNVLVEEEKQRIDEEQKLNSEKLKQDETELNALDDEIDQLENELENDK